MILIPKSYFITSGVGEDEISEINAFDLALLNAGIANYNWVQVSSILPLDASLDENKKLPKEGAILFCVMARMDGKQGEEIQSGIAIGLCKDNENKSYGLIIESNLIDCDGELIEDKLNSKLKKMSEIRKLNIVDKKINLSKRIKISKKFGTTISIVIFNDYNIYNY